MKNVSVRKSASGLKYAGGSSYFLSDLFMRSGTQSSGGGSGSSPTPPTPPTPQSCVDGVNQRYNLAVSDANNRMVAAHADCDKTYPTTWLSASHTACIKQADGHFNGAMIGINDDKRIREANCSKSSWIRSQDRISQWLR